MRVTALRTACLAGLILATAAAATQAQIVREPYRASPLLTPPAPARFYPAAAKRAHVGGRVLLSCQGRPGAVMAACAVRSESPSGYGFGKAALEMASRTWVDDRACGGAQTAPCRIQFPVVFRPN